MSFHAHYQLPLNGAQCKVVSLDDLTHKQCQNFRKIPVLKQTFGMDCKYTAMYKTRGQILSNPNQ